MTFAVHASYWSDGCKERKYTTDNAPLGNTSVGDRNKDVANQKHDATCHAFLQINAMGGWMLQMTACLPFDTIPCNIVTWPEEVHNTQAIV